MKRRDFILLCAGAAAAGPFPAGAEQATPVIGFLNSGSPDQYRSRVRAFFEGLGRHGCIENRNVTVEYRWALGDYDRLPELAADLVRRRVHVIAITRSPRRRAAAQARES